MKKFLFILGLVSSFTTYAETVNIGSIQIEVAPPKGMIKVVPEMRGIFDYIQQLNEPKSQTNWTISNYIYPIDIKDIQYKAENLERNIRICSIDIPRATINNTVTKDDFKHTVKSIKELLDGEKQDELIREAAEEDKKRAINITGKNIDKINKTINNLEILQNNSNSNIILAKIYNEVTLDTNKVERNNVITGFATIYLKNKIFMLTCQSFEEHEDWLRNEIKNWTNDIMNKNKLSFFEEIYYIGANLGGINWWSVLAAAAVGALLTSLVGVFTRTNKN